MVCVDDFAGTVLEGSLMTELAKAVSSAIVELSNSVCSAQISHT